MILAVISCIFLGYTGEFWHGFIGAAVFAFGFVVGMYFLVDNPALALTFAMKRADMTVQPEEKDQCMTCGMMKARCTCQAVGEVES